MKIEVAKSILIDAKNNQKKLAEACLTQKYFKRVIKYPVEGKQDSFKSVSSFAVVVIADHSLGVNLLESFARSFTRTEFKYEQFINNFEPCSKDDLESYWLSLLAKADQLN
jgi:hypothetical protein